MIPQIVRGMRENHVGLNLDPILLSRRAWGWVVLREAKIWDIECGTLEVLARLRLGFSSLGFSCGLLCGHTREQ